LSDLVEVDADLDALYAAVRRRYGIAVTLDPEPYLWIRLSAHRRLRRMQLLSLAHQRA
jgi:hypothetical protein